MRTRRFPPWRQRRPRSSAKQEETQTERFKADQSEDPALLKLNADNLKQPLSVCGLRQQSGRLWETVEVVLSVQGQTSAVSVIGGHCLLRMQRRVNKLTRSARLGFSRLTHSWSLAPSLTLCLLPLSPPGHKTDFSKELYSCEHPCRLCLWHSIQPMLQVHLHFEPPISSTGWCHSARMLKAPSVYKGSKRTSANTVHQVCVVFGRVCLISTAAKLIPE